MIFKSFFGIILLFISFPLQILLPVKSENRKDLSTVRLTPIGKFGLIRKERKNIPAHFHTGIDIKRPGTNYSNEPVFPIAEGKVISKRTDGPYAQLIIEHGSGSKKFWTLYEHIAGITVDLNETTDPAKPIARFMNRNELNKFGWQFDHFHLEILKVMPLRLKPGKNNPGRFFNSYTLTCYTPQDLQKYYHEPLKFMKENLH